MRFIDDIPEKFIPEETEHVDHFRVVRALIDNKCNIRSFLPTFLEPGRANSISFNPDDPESYSLSLYKTIDDLNNATRAFKSFWKTHKGYGIGFTSLNRGISLKEDVNTGHIAYYIADTYNNNPCDDFECLTEDSDENN